MADYPHLHTRLRDAAGTPIATLLDELHQARGSRYQPAPDNWVLFELQHLFRDGDRSRFRALNGKHLAAALVPTLFAKVAQAPPAVAATVAELARMEGNHPENFGTARVYVALNALLRHHYRRSAKQRPAAPRRRHRDPNEPIDCP